MAGPAPHDAPRVDLTTCDREPIHLLGRVQSHGVLLGVEARSWALRYASTPSEALFGFDAAERLGTSLVAWLDPEAQHRLRNAMQSLAHGQGAEQVYGVPLFGDDRRFDLSIHVTGDTMVFDVEPATAGDGPELVASMGQLVHRLRKAPDPESLCRLGAAQVRALTGFDRVMVYRFGADGSGEVIAESRAASMASYLGLRFPASDIPKQARALYERSLLRLIADVDDTAATVVAADGYGVLDLSLSSLRSVSEIHLEYLRNMGVAASMSISILREGRLWGLFACHHRSPHIVTTPVRAAAEAYAQVFALMVGEQAFQAERTLQRASREVHDRILASIAQQSEVADAVAAALEAVQGVIPHDGAALLSEGRWTLGGRTPPLDALPALRGWLGVLPEHPIVHLDCLSVGFPEASAYRDVASGVLALPLSRSSDDCLLLFRSEMRRTVAWAGDPSKPATVGPHGARLTPRKSFDAWREEVTGHSAPWTEGEVAAADALRTSLVEVILRLLDRANEEREQARGRQEVLIAELNHRVRNILGLIQSLVGQTGAQADSLSAFTETLGGRIHALAKAHDLLTEREWQPVALRALLDAEGEGFAPGRVTVSGDDVHLVPAAHHTVALVLHELLTNATKHGALSRPDGRVSVTVEAQPDGSMALRWVEQGGPPVQPPTSTGFGVTVIERSVPHELGGRVTVEYPTDGVRVAVWLPADVLADVEVGVAVAGRGAPLANPGRPESVTGGLALVVEDNIIIALDMEQSLREVGFDDVLIAGSVEEALEALAAQAPRVALLDIHLGRQTSAPVAEALQAAGVPFCFVSGYSDPRQGLAMSIDAPLLRKPFRQERLGIVLGELLG